MKKALKKSVVCVYHYIKGNRVNGVHCDLSGNVSGLSGNVSGLSGNVTGLSGDVDACYITDDERDAGICISHLVDK